jgi:hypothetical protein
MMTFAVPSWFVNLRHDSQDRSQASVARELACECPSNGRDLAVGYFGATGKVAARGEIQGLRRWRAKRIIANAKQYVGPANIMAGKNDPKTLNLSLSAISTSQRCCLPAPKKSCVHTHRWKLWIVRLRTVLFVGLASSTLVFVN